MMKEKNKSILIALSFIAALILFVWGFNFLKGKSISRNQLTLYAIYGNSMGLIPGDLVTINGMLVGNVNALKFHPKKDGSIIVTFTVRNDINIPENSIARLASSLLGSVSLDIVLGNSSTLVQNGDTLNAEYDMGTMGMINEELLPLKDKLENLMLSLTNLSDNLNSIINDELKNDINNGMNSFASVMDNIDNLSSDLKKLIDNNDEKLNQSIQNLENITRDFSAVSDSLSKIKYTHLVASLEDCISDVNTLIKGVNEGKGSAGLLLNDDSLYNNVNEAISTLQQLLDEIKENPKKIKLSVF